MVNDFLFELGCEELPSGAVEPLSLALKQSMLAALEKAKVSFVSLQAFATPRRLAILIKGLPTEVIGQATQRRGPALAAAYDSEGNPSKALIGFAKSCGVSIDQLTVSKTDKGEWLVYDSLAKTSDMRDMLPALVKASVAALPIVKPMRWGNGEVEFARPVHWIVMLWGAEVLTTDILGVAASNQTRGHRFLAPHSVTINQPADYEALLHELYVVADFSKRRDIIIEQIKHAAATHQAQAIMPASLIDEVTSIVEWPEALIASFEAHFLEVPSEALIASMQAHQKCFALQDSHQQLLPYFITVTNLHSQKPEQVIAGNEKVMRARLSDAAFFYTQDKKQPLSDYIAATANVVFQIRLGTLLDKTTRIKALLETLIPVLNLNRQDTLRAAELSKCDLLTGMVNEFPELQGLMGSYYALHDKETPAVARALFEQYLPRFAGDSLPNTPVGMALSLADRLDTLAGIFAINQKPSGDKDPFKLRRHALAVVRLLVNISAPLHLSQLISDMLVIYGDKVIDAKTIASDLHAFIFDRLQSYYQAEQISADMVQAVKICQAECLADFDRRIHALARFVALPEAAILSAACKRVNNLLQGTRYTNDINEQLLAEDAEKSLFHIMLAMEETIAPLYANSEYSAVLDHLARLRAPVDAFFEQVMVMVDDSVLKMNRLALLTRLQQLLQGVADISLINQVSS